jgi:3-oxoacyl-[acyl-carrier-protein] synthase II
LPAGEKIDLLISGENGDNRILKFYTACEEMMDRDTAIIRYKHLSGDMPTASAFALWLACHILKPHKLPLHMIKRTAAASAITNILLYNNYKGLQHSFMLVRKN